MRAFSLLKCLEAFVGEATGTCGFPCGEIFQLQINVSKLQKTFGILFLYVSVLICCVFEDHPLDFNCSINYTNSLFIFVSVHRIRPNQNYYYCYYYYYFRYCWFVLFFFLFALHWSDQSLANCSTTKHGVQTPPLNASFHSFWGTPKRTLARSYDSCVLVFCLLLFWFGAGVFLVFLYVLCVCVCMCESGWVGTTACVLISEDHLRCPSLLPPCLSQGLFDVTSCSRLAALWVPEESLSLPHPPQ